jgi:prepilin-type processing-associated H-X9-DG protein
MPDNFSDYTISAHMGGGKVYGRDLPLQKYATSQCVWWGDGCFNECGGSGSNLWDCLCKGTLSRENTSYSWSWPVSSAATSGKTTHPGGAANFAFGDGHVKAVTYEDHCSIKLGTWYGPGSWAEKCGQ